MKKLYIAGCSEDRASIFHWSAFDASFSRLSIGVEKVRLRCSCRVQAVHFHVTNFDITEDILQSMDWLLLYAFTIAISLSSIHAG